jgi:hypothetical protein
MLDSHVFTIRAWDIKYTLKTTSINLSLSKRRENNREERHIRDLREKMLQRMVVPVGLEDKKDVSISGCFVFTLLTPRMFKLYISSF